MRLVVIAGTHAAGAPNAAIPTRRNELAPVLLHRALHRANRLLKPDAVAILGDVVNDGGSDDCRDLLQGMHEVMTLCDAPVLVIPGNHDPDADEFYSVMPRPPAWLDVAGARLVPFVDPEEPGYNARREPDMLARMRAARVGWTGPIVALQHVPVFPVGTTDCPYNYTNADDVIDAMAANGIQLAVAGHRHAGFDPVRNEHSTFVAAPALCEQPFGFLVIDIDGDDITISRRNLAMPSELGLIDTHVHTQLAYCQENMDADIMPALAGDFGLAGIIFTEHSGHLYFDRQEYWSGACQESGIAGARPEACRMPEYLDILARIGCSKDVTGMEVDVAFDGSLLLREEDSSQLGFRIGAVHGLASLRTPQPDEVAAHREFLFLTEALLKSGVDTLAHPFRVFRRANMPLPDKLIAPTVQLLRDYGVAAEINFHTNEPSPAFITQCLDAGVPITLGSDSHNLYEIGAFALHLDLLERCGAGRDPRPVLHRRAYA